MKRLWILAILMLVLVGCRGSIAPTGWRCSEGLCVKIKVVEPVRWGEPVTVIISVTAEKDVADLGVWLNHDQGVTVEGPQGWEENVKDRKIGEMAASWKVDVKANKPLVFMRKVHLPQREGEIELSAAVYRADLGYLVDSVSIYLTREGGKVYYAGTPVPITPWPLPVYIVTPGSSPTPQPTFTPTPTLPPTPTPPRSPLATPTPLAYPFTSPLPTPMSYP